MKRQLGLKRKQVIAAYERHQTMRGAAAELGCTYQNIREHLVRAGYTTRFNPRGGRPTTWADHELEVVMANYKRGKTASQIGEMLNRTKNEVIGKANRMGL